jgi:hypothetical protein
MASAAALSDPAGPSLRVQAFGPDADPVPADALARLFPRVPPHSARFDRLARSARIVVTRGSRIVGFAVYQRIDGEVRVPDLALLAPPGHGVRDVLGALLDALEAACLAGGSRRIVLPPTAPALGLLRRRGYELMSEGCAGAWMEKTLR